MKPIIYLILILLIFKQPLQSQENIAPLAKRQLLIAVEQAAFIAQAKYMRGDIRIVRIGDSALWNSKRGPWNDNTIVTYVPTKADFWR